ncbi:MAG: hypothetical protein ACREJM_05060, partial [Candidatus Saccharimonadales bacterium]
IDADLKRRYETFLAQNGIAVAGLEFISDRDGVRYTYDVNTNTNYNADAEARAGRSAMDELAHFLGRELARTQACAPANRPAPATQMRQICSTSRPAGG